MCTILSFSEDGWYKNVENKLEMVWVLFKPTPKSETAAIFAAMVQ